MRLRILVFDCASALQVPANSSIAIALALVVVVLASPGYVQGAGHQIRGRARRRCSRMQRRHEMDLIIRCDGQFLRRSAGNDYRSPPPCGRTHPAADRAMAPWCRRARTAENRQVADGSGATLQCGIAHRGGSALAVLARSRHRSGALHSALGHRRTERDPIFTRHLPSQEA